MVYDYIITKPELNEDTLAHYGIKGMKWHKKLKGKYYSTKSKIGEAVTKRNRKKRGYETEYISNHYGTTSAASGPHMKTLIAVEKKSFKNPEILGFTNGNYNKSNRDTIGFTGSNSKRGIEAGRERVKKRKNK